VRSAHPTIIRICGGTLLAGGLSTLVVLAHDGLRGIRPLQAINTDAWNPSDISLVVCVSLGVVGFITTILTRASFFLVGLASTLPFEVPLCLQILRDVKADPTADNLWPLGLAFWGLSGVPAALGAIAASAALVKSGRSGSLRWPHFPVGGPRA
jgi:hypothetical protein